MRCAYSIAKATALEILSQPLSLLILTATLAVETFAPRFQFHKFGESDAMARDAGLSAILLGAIFFVVFTSVSALRREIEKGTLSLALTSGISRTYFVTAKFLGFLSALLGFFSIAFFNMVITVNGAVIGGVIAKSTGDIPMIWGRSYALSVLVMVLPYLIGAIANRFLNRRFVFNVFLWMMIFSFAFLFYRIDFDIVLRLLSATAVIFAFVVIYLSLSVALSLNFKAHTSHTIIGVIFALTLPVMGNFYLADALSHDGAVNLSYIGLSALSALLISCGVLILGLKYFKEKDL